MKEKSKFYIGVTLIIIAFVSVVVIIYFVINAHTAKVKETYNLKEKVDILSTEKELAQSKAYELEKDVGKVLYLEDIIDESNKRYGKNEKDRKEGSLWIDRNENIFIVTLGVLNGLTSGMRLSVYDADELIGFVRVEAAMDVISYVKPVTRTLDEFASDYYRVVIDQ